MRLIDHKFLNPTVRKIYTAVHKTHHLVTLPPAWTPPDSAPTFPNLGSRTVLSSPSLLRPNSQAEDR